jgi:hypothetical protein
VTDAHAKEFEDLKVRAVLSVPIVGWVPHFGLLQEALGRLNIPYDWAHGAYWGQSLQFLLNKSIEKGADVVLTMDFDSIFSFRHLDRLLHTLCMNPEIDALAPLQSRRHTDQALFGTGKHGPANIDVTSDKPFRVKSAHFGMTAIRLDTLAKLPKPWFHAIPDAEGDWGEGHVDADVAFWHKWADAGFSCYLDPGIRIGHLQPMVAEFDEKMRTRHVHWVDWRNREKRLQALGHDVTKPEPRVTIRADRPYSFDGPYSRVFAAPEESMDPRHIYTVHEILANGGFKRALEIGCLNGASATAFVEAMKLDEELQSYFCDVQITGSLWQVLLDGDISRTCVSCQTSVGILQDGPEFDFVLVDGAHDLETVKQEVALLMKRKPRCIMAHDTSAAENGYEGAEGPRFLRDQFVDNLDYYCLEDRARRDGERTERGLFFATTDESLFEIAKQAFEKFCAVSALQEAVA